MEYWKTPKHHITYENTDGSWSSLSLAQDLTFMKGLNSGSKRAQPITICKGQTYIWLAAIYKNKYK